MNIVEALKEEHKTLRELLDKTKKDPSQFEELRKHLLVHEQNEEATLLEVLNSRKDMREHVLEAFEEHRVIDWMLVSLKDFPRDHERWKVKLGVLAEFCEHHLEEEEEKIFPHSSEHLSREEMDGLGEDYQRHQREQLHAL